MCRWLAYYGSPIPLEDLLYKADHSLIDQSLHARLGVETTNGDGVGVGWYGLSRAGLVGNHANGRGFVGSEAGGSALAPSELVGSAPPALFRATGPAWSDENLRELSAAVRSPLFFAHIRASTGTAVQQSNCHPFRFDRWLWMHNGSLRRFAAVKRDLVQAVDPALFPALAGSTDSELMFHLALTFGLEHEPVRAMERMVGFAEAVGRRHGVRHPVQMTVATTNGEQLWVFRYSSEGTSRTLFFSTAVGALRAMYPENQTLRDAADETRIVVSEPLGRLAGAWQPVPEATYGVIRDGADELGPFRPAAP